MITAKIKQLASKFKLSNILNGNTGLSLFSKTAAMFLFLITDIAVARILNKSDYGEWSFFLSVVSIGYWIGLFGINTSARIFVAGSGTDPGNRNAYMASSFFIRTLISVLMLITFFFLGSPLADILGYPEKYGHLKTLFTAAPLMIFFNSLMDFCKEVNVALINFKNVFWLTISEFGGGLLFGAGFLLLFGNAGALSLGYTAAYCLAAVTGFFMIFRHMRRDGGLDGLRIDAAYVKQIIAYAVPVLLVNMGTAALVEMDTFLIGVFLDKRDVGIYNIAKSLLSKMTHINLAVCVSTMTGFVILTRQNSRKKWEQFLKLNKLNLLLTGGIALLMFLFAPTAVRLLYGREYLEAASVMRALTPYYIQYSICIFTSAFLDYQRKARLRAFYFALLLICNLALDLLMIPKWGTAGAAVATGISMIPYTLLLFISSAKVFKLKSEGREI